MIMDIIRQHYFVVHVILELFGCEMDFANQQDGKSSMWVSMGIALLIKEKVPCWFGDKKRIF